MELANENDGGMVENSNYKTLMNEWVCKQDKVDEIHDVLQLLTTWKSFWDIIDLKHADMRLLLVLLVGHIYIWF